MLSVQSFCQKLSHFLRLQVFNHISDHIVTRTTISKVRNFLARLNSMHSSTALQERKKKRVDCATHARPQQSIYVNGNNLAYVMVFAYGKNFTFSYLSLS